MQEEIQIERGAVVTIKKVRPNLHNYELVYPIVVGFNMVAIRHHNGKEVEELLLGVHELDSFVEWLAQARDILAIEKEARSKYVEQKPV